MVIALIWNNFYKENCYFSKKIISSLENLIFKMLRDNWKNIEEQDIEISVDFVKKGFAVSNNISSLMLYKAQLDEAFIKEF